MRILQVSTFDVGGGAEKVAWNLFKSYQVRGHQSWLVVGFKKTENSNVVLIPNQWNRAFWFKQFYLGKFLRSFRGGGRLAQWLYFIFHPLSYIETQLGFEDFNFPLSRRLMNLVPESPDIIHCHNLHGSYFDLRVLPKMSGQIPVVLTLHDSWFFTGHCAHTFDCDRWKNGCGQCPDLSIYPSIKKDRTANNWKRKQKIFSHSRVYVASPSHWILKMLEKSMMAPSVIESRVIPNGVDLSLFFPKQKEEARATLDIQPNIFVLLFSANGIRKNPWKDYKTIENAIRILAKQGVRKKVLFVALGEGGRTEKIGGIEIRFVTHQKDIKMVSHYYQSADIYIHASKVDTFPNAIIEALACGTPVVATGVGGIPEQIKSLKVENVNHPVLVERFYERVEATGVLVSESDSDGMAKAILMLLNDEALRKSLGFNASRDAAERFDQDQQTSMYLDWYKTILFKERTLIKSQKNNKKSGRD